MKLQLPLILIATALLASCATPLEQRVDRDVTRDADRVAAELRAARENPSSIRRIHDAPYIAARAIDYSHELDTDSAADAVLDEPLHSASGTATRVPEALALLELAIERKLRLQLTPDALDWIGETGESTHRATVELPPTATLRRYLDLITGQTGTAWSLQGDTVAIRRYLVETFELPAIGGEYNATGNASSGQSYGGSGSSGTSGGTSGGGSSGQGSSVSTSVSNSQSASLKLDSDIYAAVVDPIKALAGPDATIAVGGALSSITVRATPMAMNDVRAYVAHLHQRLKRMVVVDLRLISVELNDSQSAGLNLDFVRAAAGDFYGVGASTASGVTGATNAIQATVIDPNSPYADSSVLMEALAQQGRTKEESTLTLRAMNYRPSYLQLVSAGYFFGGSQPTVITNGATIVQEPELREISTGVALTLIPNILNHRELVLGIQSSVTSRNRDDVHQIGEDRRTTPNQTRRDFMQSALTESGSTIILSGLDQDILRSDGRGVGNAKFRLLGGGGNAARDRRVLLLVLTPRIVLGGDA